MNRKPSSTRERILQAANELFYARGFYRVSVDSIAEAAGVTKRTVYYHFNSKDDIIAQVLSVQHIHLMQQVERWSGATIPPKMRKNWSTRFFQNSLHGLIVSIGWVRALPA